MLYCTTQHMLPIPDTHTPTTPIHNVAQYTLYDPHNPCYIPYYIHSTPHRGGI